jgi:hypothetical protein
MKTACASNGSSTGGSKYKYNVFVYQKIGDEWFIATEFNLHAHKTNGKR